MSAFCCNKSLEKIILAGAYDCQLKPLSLRFLFILHQKLAASPKPVTSASLVAETNSRVVFLIFQHAIDVHTHT